MTEKEYLEFAKIDIGDRFTYQDAPAQNVWEKIDDNWITDGIVEFKIPKDCMGDLVWLRE